MARQANRVDEHVMKLFITAIEEAGGSRRLVEQRRLEWLPDLLQAAYIVVLQEEERQEPEEIAAYLGVSTASVESVLSAPTETAISHLDDEPPQEQAEREHVAGGVAKFTWQRLHRMERRSAER